MGWLVDMPHKLLWLAKAYVIPASMYSSQIWGTGYIHEEGSGGGLSLADWSSLLFEACPGREAYFLQLVCAEGVVRSLSSFTGFGLQCGFIIRLLGATVRLKKVWHADKGMCAMPGATSCWTAEVMAAFEGLQGGDQYRNAVRSGSAVNAKELAVDLRACLCKVWEELNDTEPRE